MVAHWHSVDDDTLGLGALGASKMTLWSLLLAIDKSRFAVNIFGNP
jgi:hypothetical protein